MKKNIIFIALFLLIGMRVYAQIPVYLDVDKPIEERVEDALMRMTLEEKINMLHAQSKFCSKGVSRLGIPENWMTDGPHGIREEVFWDEWDGAKWTNDSCIAFPALTCLAATWNTDMAALYGKSIGQEARYRNKNVLLGPGVNIYRTPLNGRNFEYMGEDPYLAARMVVPYVQQVQKNNVAACVKHFALNNQEENRHTIDVVLDDRALYEIYLPAFKAAVQEGGAWAIMGAYNKYKGEYCCHNQYLLNDILKGEWGFDGVVVSDWGGTENTWQAIHNGLDMEFGSWTDGMKWGVANAYDNYYLALPYLNLIKEGKVGTKELDDKVRRILRLVFRTNMAKNRAWGSFGTEEHALAGRQIAEEGIVLLQNNNRLLPLNLNETKKILIVGDNARQMMTVGGGSSSLKAKYEVVPFDGISSYVGQHSQVSYARGYLPFTGDVKPESETLREEAVEAAKDADVVIYVGGLNKWGCQDCEGVDRWGYGLPYEQDKLISALAEVNPNIVVVLISGNAIAMPWANEVSSILYAWYGGTEAGNALARVLYGDVNPSGKLPFTIARQLDHYAAHALNAYNAKDSAFVEYKESIFVGYRWIDKQKKIKPLFPFGHGLSYTTFEYGKPTLDKQTLSGEQQITLTVSVKNNGTRAGSEVVQLYIADKKSTLPRPLKELKGFRKVHLLPSQEEQLVFVIDKEALCFFDDRKHEWVAEPGKFEALIGASATDIKGKVMFEYSQSKP